MGSTAYLVDKDTVFARGLTHLLACHFGINLLGQCPDLEQASGEIIKLTPDLLFIDASGAVFDYLSSLRKLSEHCPNTKMTVFADAPTLAAARELLSLGLQACVLKPLTVAVLEKLFLHLKRDEAFIGPGFETHTRESSIVMQTGRCGFDIINNRLSDRETQILVRTANGQSAAEIAAEFDISVKTADWHRRNVYSKLHLKNVAQLTKFALRAGLVALD